MGLSKGLKPLHLDFPLYKLKGLGEIVLRGSSDLLILSISGPGCLLTLFLGCLSYPQGYSMPPGTYQQPSLGPALSTRPTFPANYLGALKAG